MRPKVSIGLIVKNEIRCLERCLKALQPLRDAVPSELVIADTGSTDGTREIAQKYADICFDFEWINDFSAARNAVMDRCSGEWFFSIDADEYLDHNIETLKKFFLFPHKKQVEFAFVIVRNYANKNMDDNYSDFSAARITRMAHGARFVGSIHETWIIEENETLVILEDVILHHDGYAFFSEEQTKKKKQRNLDLLEKELEQAPRSLRRLLQCIESSDCFKEKIHHYLCRSMKLLQDETVEDRKRYIGPIVRYAVTMSCKFDFDEYEEWLAFAQKHCTENIYYLVDIAYAQVAKTYENKQYKEADHWLEVYWKGIQTIENNPPYQFYEQTRYSSLQYYDKQTQQKMRYTQIDVLVHLEEWDKADKCALSTHFSVDEFMNNSECYKTFHKLAKRKKVQKKIGNLINSSIEHPEKHAVFINILQQAYAGTSEEWRLYTYVSGDIGLGIQAMDVPASQLYNHLTRVEDWSMISYHVIERAIYLNVGLPDSFYKRPIEQIRNVVKLLSNNQMSNMAHHVLSWVQDYTDSPSVQCASFIYELVWNTLQTVKWNIYSQIGPQLYSWFVRIGDCYFNRYYSCDILEKTENWNLIPVHHQFALYVLQAQKCLEGNDALGWTISLHNALEIIPAMKSMIEFLIDHPPETVQSQELKQLAQKVKAILSQYPQDDPAILAIKQSPVYQKVAHLIERSQKVVPVPVYEQPDPRLNQQFSVLMDYYSSQSLDEIKQQIETAYNQVDNVNQKILVNYWKTYSLWGRDKDEVINNFATAFFQNREKFRWMYENLRDNLSKKILLAVLQNWIHFNFQLLSEVRETKYDDYFDRDLISCNENDVVVDLGGYIGDTFTSFIKNFGTCKRYYCYEISKENFAKILQLTSRYPMLDCRLKGAGDKVGSMYLHRNKNGDLSANQLTEQGSEEVEIVTIDEDIDEPITFLKMDIEGAEQSALRGCERHIKEDKPKLALSVYHNFEDIWKLAYMVEEWVPGYQFYLRYHGGNLWPSEITLIGIPPQ